MSAPMPQRRRRSFHEVPHLAVGPSRKYQAHGFPQIDRPTACGRRVATTRPDLVKCPECRVSIEATP